MFQPKAAALPYAGWPQRTLSQDRVERKVFLFCTSRKVQCWEVGTPCWLCGERQKQVFVGRRPGHSPCKKQNVLWSRKVHPILYFHTAQCISARLSQVLPHLISPQESQQHFREGKGQGLGSKSPQQLVGVKDCNEHFSSSSSCPRWFDLTRPRKA